ncbi:hypothetical protein [Mycolicibacterium pulveris]|uniref:hypothetical protein n=1 Tax=Mycolicibacterium pulveris TaxID=36813 RepID=UPI003CED3055
MIDGVAAPAPAAPVAVVIGLGGLTVVVAVWSLLAIDPTRDFLTMAVTGLALFSSPWVVDSVGDMIGWTAWVAGAVIAAIGVAGYVRGERLDFATTVRGEAEARYREQFRSDGR